MVLAYPELPELNDIIAACNKHKANVSRKGKEVWNSRNAHSGYQYNKRIGDNLMKLIEYNKSIPVNATVKDVTDDVRMFVSECESFVQEFLLPEIKHHQSV